MKTTDYVTAIKARTATGSVYAAAKLLQIHEETVRNWAKGKSLPDSWGCIRIADVLDLPPLQVIADIEAEREGDTQRAARWKDLGRKFASSVLAVSCITIGSFGDSKPSEAGKIPNGACRIICIM